MAVKGRILDLELFSIPPDVVKGRVISMELFGTSDTVAVSPNLTVPSYSTVTIAAAFTGIDPTPDFEWQQASGPSVVLVPNDTFNTCQVVIQPFVGAVPVVIVIQVRAAIDDGVTEWASCSITATPHVKWLSKSGIAYPVGSRQFIDAPGAPVVPPNPDIPVTPPIGIPTEGAWYIALAPGYGTKKGMPHFYPPFPISVSNDAEPSYWKRKWLTPSIEGQTDHRVYGGYIREEAYDKYRGNRPQPTGWELNDAKQNVEQAALYGMDGFFLEMLGAINSSNNIRNLAIRDAANALFPGGQFKATPMPDFNSPTVNAFTADQLADYLAPFAVTDPRPNLASYTPLPSAWYLPDGRFVWSCFRGDVATGNGLTAWPKSRFDAVFASLLSRYKINSAFIVGVNSISASANYVGTGYYGWNHWGAGADPNVALKMSNNTAVAQTRGQVYMMSIWPSDIRYYQGLYDDSYNTGSLRAYCNRLISDGADHAQMTTWSDYSEGATWQRSAGRGRVLAKLYGWFNVKWKTGNYPTILRDCIILSHRNQLFPTGSTYRYNDPAYTKKAAHWDRGVNTSPIRNNIEVLTFLLGPATVNLKINGTIVSSVVAPAGMYVFDTTPAQVGTVSVEVIRASTLVAQVTSNVTIKSNPLNQNANYYYVDSIDGSGEQYDPTEGLGI